LALRVLIILSVLAVVVSAVNNPPAFRPQPTNIMPAIDVP
jgi:hypothetical protein